VNPEIRLGLMPPGRKAKWRRGGHTSTTATCAPAAKPLILRRPTAPDKVWPRPSSCLDIKSLSSNQKIFEVIHYFTQSHLTHRNEMSITPNVSATGVLSVTDWTPPPIDRLNFTQNCDLAGEFYGTWFQGLLDLEPGADPLAPYKLPFSNKEASSFVAETLDARTVEAYFRSALPAEIKTCRLMARSSTGSCYFDKNLHDSFRLSRSLNHLCQSSGPRSNGSSTRPSKRRTSPALSVILGWHAESKRVQPSSGTD